MRVTTNNTSNTNENEDEVSANDEEESSDNEISDNEELSDNEEQEISDNERSEEEEELIEEEQPVISVSNNKYKIKPQSQLQTNTIYKKVKKNTNSKGVDNIEQLPLDWFTKVRQTQKQHNIIPRKSDGKK